MWAAPLEGEKANSFDTAILCCSLINDTLNSSDYTPIAPNDRMFNERSIGKMWNKIFVAYFKVFAWSG